MCSSHRPTEGADSATGIEREEVLQRLDVYAPGYCPGCGCLEKTDGPEPFCENVTCDCHSRHWAYVQGWEGAQQ